MKMTKYTVSVLMAGILSFSAVSAEEVTQAQADSQQLVSLGTVSTTAETTSPMDAKKELSRLADEKGGKYFKVIAGREHGRISAVAEVYK